MRLRLTTLITALTLLASGLAPAQLTRQSGNINLPATLPTATGYQTSNAFPGITFSAAMALVSIPGETNRLFVAERAGLLHVVSNLSTTPVKSQYLSLASLLVGDEALDLAGENGFLSITFHPNFANNRTLYAYFTVKTAGQNHQRLHQITVSSASSNAPTITQHKPLLSILDHRETNHNGGTIAFGADGFLYLSTGDEGGGGDNQNNARFINHRVDPVGTANRVTRTGFWGQMLRIAVEVDPVGQPGVFPANTELPNPHVQVSTTYPSAVHGNYRVPVDNPFRGFTSWHNLPVDPLTVRTEIWATGFRNPFRWSFDPPTGRLFMGDVGQNVWEEVNIVTKGGDYGWSWLEGNHAHTPPAPTTPPAVGFNPIAPIFEYDHTNSGTGDIHGNVITGGIVYRSGALSELLGKYIYSDYGSGQIVALTENAGTWTPTLLAADTAIVHFGVHPLTGEMLMCDLNSSTAPIKRLIRSGTSGTAPPATLSATLAFSNLANLTPAAGVVPYSPNVSFWSDYAIKSRWFTIENLVDTVGFSAEGNWTFPTGMIWVKHFDIETTRGVPATRRKLETRFLVKTATDVYGITYKWRADQSDADLVPEAGFTEEIPGSSPAQIWRYPSRTECRVCHSPAGGFALSFNTRQLNRTNTFDAETLNQITALAQAGYLTGMNSAVNTLPAHVPANDTTASLESRVRSYLAVNCVQCHQPGGAATGNWDARITTPTDAAGLINGPLVNSDGDPLNRWAVPNDPAHSMVLKRLQGTAVQRMPPLGSNERDLVGEALITEWINSLGTRQNFAQWQSSQFSTVGGAGSSSAQPEADPDFDGHTNRLEYLLSQPPLVLDPPLVPETTMDATTITLTFDQPANRSVIVETSTDLGAWSTWDVPGNTPFFPATSLNRTLTGPREGAQRVFRLRYSEL